MDLHTLIIVYSEDGEAHLNASAYCMPHSSIWGRAEISKAMLVGCQNKSMQ